MEHEEVLKQLQQAHAELGAALQADDVEAAARAVLVTARRPDVRQAGRKRPGRKPAPELVAELKATVKAKGPGLTWEEAERAVSAEHPEADAAAIALKWAWTKGEKLYAGPPARRQPAAERQQAIEAAAQLLDERLPDYSLTDKQFEAMARRAWQLACADWLVFAATIAIKYNLPPDTISVPGLPTQLE